MESDSQRSKSYRRELHDLVQRACTDGEMGSMPMRSLLLNEAQYCHHLSQNAFTIEHSLDTWIDNFRANLIKNDGPLLSPLDMGVDKTDRKVLVIGAGASAKSADLTHLSRDMTRDDTIVICTNKSLSYLLGQGIVPHIMVTLHSTRSILHTFKTPEIQDWTGHYRRKLTHTKFVIPSTIDPEVLAEMRQIGLRSNERWFNPAVPEEQVENINQFMERMNGFPVIDTGGDVGVFALLIALEMTTGPVGILGLEHCLPLNEDWTNEQALGYRIEYAPEDKTCYAIPPSFQVTLDTMMKLCNSTGKDRVYNLAKFGPMYSRKSLPQSTLEVFLSSN